MGGGHNAPVHFLSVRPVTHISGFFLPPPAHHKTSETDGAAQARGSQGVFDG